jgi:hypothetical protein
MQHWRRFCGALAARLPSLVFVALALYPVVRRILHPAIANDDVIRLVNILERPLHKLIFWPCNEHVAILFNLISWITWQLIGHDLRLAPLGYSIASVIPWILVLVLFGFLMYRESGSRTAALIAVVIVAQSPLVLETVWWYSASSFTWAVTAIMLALLGASGIGRRFGRALLLVGLGSALGPASTSLGLLAMPLAMLRGFLDQKASWRARFLVAGVALGGVLAYLGACRLGGIQLPRTIRANNAQMADPLAGAGYAFTVPGRLLVPSALGVPAHWCVTALPAWLGWGTGTLVLMSLATLVFWRRVRYNTRLVLVGTAMIYLAYGLTYISRAGLVRQGRWTEYQLIYLMGSRYHVLPLLGVAAVLGAVLASWRSIRWCDVRPGLPALAGSVVGLMMLALQQSEISAHWTFLITQSDQQATMAALDHVGRVARAEGITRSQLVRIVAPALRSWNDAVRTDCPAAFPLMKLVEAPKQSGRPRTDDEARAILLAGLTYQERIALGAGACASVNSAPPGADLRVLSTARLVQLNRIRETNPGRYRSDEGPAFVRYEFDPTTGGEFLELPGLAADQDLIVYWCDSNSRWLPGLNLRWFPSPRRDAQALVDMRNLIHAWGQPITQIAIQLTRPGEIALGAPPRLLRSVSVAAYHRVVAGVQADARPITSQARVLR